jgi:nitrite reductase (NADH) small subunit
MAYQLACKLNDLVAGAGRELLVEGRIVALFLVDGQVFAVDGICAHQGGPIGRGAVDRNCVTCPWHGWQYDVRHGTNLLTGRQMLDCFPVEVRGEEVWIDVHSTA